MQVLKYFFQNFEPFHLTNFWKVDIPNREKTSSLLMFTTQNFPKIYILSKYVKIEQYHVHLSKIV